MKVFTNKLTQQIYQILVPLIGDLVSASVLKLQSRKLGIDEESITVKHLTQLSEGIRLGLVVFLGSDAASRVAKKIIDLGNLH